MSMHKSLKLKNTLVGQRSVLSRWERIEKLKSQDRWTQGDKVTGLPKVRTKFKVRARKVAVDPAAAPAAAAPGAAAAAAAAPAAAGKAPAAAAKAPPAKAPATKPGKK